MKHLLFVPVQHFSGFVGIENTMFCLIFVPSVFAAVFLWVNARVSVLLVNLSM